MMSPSQLRGPDRAVALLLAVIWLAAGLTAIFLGIENRRWALCAAALFALFYGVLWARVAARERLLTWRDVVAPWRAR